MLAHKLTFTTAIILALASVALSNQITKPAIIDTLNDSMVVVISPEGDTLVKPMPSPVEIDSTKDAIKLHKLAPLPADLLPPHRKGKRGAGGIVNHRAKPQQNQGIETKSTREQNPENSKERN